MRMLRGLLRFMMAAFFAVNFSAFSHPADIQNEQITPSTTMPIWFGYTVDKLADGLSVDSGTKHGFTTNNKTGTIRLTLDKAYNINGFKLWNDVTVRAEGVKDFRLIFFKNNGTEETSQVFTARSGQVDVQTFTFPEVKNVVRVDLVILSSLKEHNTFLERIEIRELAFIEAPAIINTAPNAVDDEFKIDEKQSLRISPLANDTDLNGDPITLSRVFNVPPEISVLMAASNRLLITAKETPGPLEFNYEAVDSKGSSSIGIIRGEVIEINDPPTLLQSSYSITLNGRNSQNLDLASLATDLNGDPLKISRLYAASPNLKVVQLNDTTAQISALDRTSQHSFNFDIIDGRGGSVTGTIRIIVDNPPVWPYLLGGITLLLLMLAALKLTRLFNSGGKPPLKRPETSGLVFSASPLFASNVATPLSSAGQLTASSLQTLTGPYAVLRPAYLSTGRIGFAQKGKPTNKDIAFGTGFLITPNHVMTNRHVYEVYKDHLIGKSGGGIEFHAEKDKDATDFITFDGNTPYLPPGIDIAIFKLSRPVVNRKPIPTKPVDVETLNDRNIVVIGYPCPSNITEHVAAAVEDNPVFAVKRISQGKIFRHSTDVSDPYGIEAPVSEKIRSNGVMPAVCHNASTLGGSSGSPLLDERTGELLGVHFGFDVSFEWEEAANFAMAIKTVMEGLKEFDID